MPLAVPTLVAMRERLADGFGHAKPGRQAGGHLAMSGQAAVLHPRIGHRPDHAADPAVQGKILGQVAHEVAHALARLSQQHRCHGGVQRHLVAARQDRGLRCIRRAAHKAKQRHVVHARSRRRIQPELRRRSQRQPARTQPVLHGLTGAQIRRQRQRDRQLGQASRPGLVSHTITLPAETFRWMTAAPAMP